MSPALRKKLLAASAGGAMAIAVALVVGHEGLEGREYVPYRDVVGVLTVCYGHTGKDVIAHKRYTPAECQALLDNDLKAAMAVIDANVTVPLTESQKAALVSFVYNVGSGAFERSTLLKKLNAGDIAGACHEMKRWKYVDGKVSKGLVSRRNVERELCLKSEH